ncbi:hypothetical protein P3C24_26945, partial [Pseudomonas proteolytica]|uniref:hypothetical protein n=1 Tax=Pseudomonas proteolytica TaxID=219574 RepID=UPI0023DE8D9B
VVDPLAKPVVDVTDITGTLQVGQSLTGVYSYDDNGTGSADASSKVWLNGGHASTDLSYALDAADVGKVLTFEVEAKNQAGTVGNTDRIDTATATGVNGGGQINPGVVVDPLAKPVVDVTDITGTLQVGQSLTGVYSYDDNGTGSADASSKVWLNGGHASTDLSYALDAADVGKVLTFEVEAKNQAGTVGNTDRIDTATATGVNGGGQINPGAVVDPLAKPVVDVTDITGTLQVGQSLTGVYSYDDNGTGSADASSKVWLNGGHASTDLSYALDAADVGKVLTFEVEAKNQAGTVGNTDRIDTATATGVN